MEDEGKARDAFKSSNPHTLPHLVNFVCDVQILLEVMSVVSSTLARYFHFPLIGQSIFFFKDCQFSTSTSHRTRENKYSHFFIRH